MEIILLLNWSSPGTYERLIDWAIDGGAEIFEYDDDGQRSAWVGVRFLGLKIAFALVFGAGDE